MSEAEPQMVANAGTAEGGPGTATARFSSAWPRRSSRYSAILPRVENLWRSRRRATGQENSPDSCPTRVISSTTSDSVPTPVSTSGGSMVGNAGACWTPTPRRCTPPRDNCCSSGRDTLFAQNFDPVRLELSGDPFAVVGGAIKAGPCRCPSRVPIVFRQGGMEWEWGTHSDIWMVRRVRPEIEKRATRALGVGKPQMSPDGRHVAM